MDYDALLNRLRSELHSELRSEFHLTPINPAAAPASGIRTSGLPATSTALACLPSHFGVLRNSEMKRLEFSVTFILKYTEVSAIQPGTPVLSLRTPFTEYNTFKFGKLVSEIQRKSESFLTKRLTGYGKAERDT